MSAWKWSVLLVAVSIVANFHVAAAAPIAWSSGDFDADSDVLNAGTTVFAYYFTGSTNSVSAAGTSTLSGTQTVNGVVWDDIFVALASNAQNEFPPSGFTTAPALDTAAYGHTLATTGFGSLIAGVGFKGGPLTVTLSNLTPGNQYALQWLYHHAGVQGRTTTLNDGLGNQVTLTNRGITLTGTASVTDGEFAVGTFTADATTQSFLVTASSGSVLVSGVQLRLVPEPSFVGLFAIMCGLLSARRSGTSRKPRKLSQQH